MMFNRQQSVSEGSTVTRPPVTVDPKSSGGNIYDAPDPYEAGKRNKQDKKTDER
jgi:hypothetical protein